MVLSNAYHAVLTMLLSDVGYHSVADKNPGPAAMEVDSTSEGGLEMNHGAEVHQGVAVNPGPAMKVEGGLEMGFAHGAEVHQGVNSEGLAVRAWQLDNSDSEGLADSQTASLSEGMADSESASCGRASGPGVPQPVTPPEARPQPVTPPSHRGQPYGRPLGSHMAAPSGRAGQPCLQVLQARLQKCVG